MQYSNALNFYFFTLCHFWTQQTFKWIPINRLSESCKSCVTDFLSKKNSLNDYISNPLPPVRLSLYPWEELIEALDYAMRQSLCSPNQCTVIQHIINNKRSYLSNIVDHFDYLESVGGQYLTLSCKTYPRLLKFIPDPPYGLSLIGNPRLLDRKLISIVGSRIPPIYILKQTQLLSHQLASLGYVIVSGGALGCDIAAHQNASKESNSFQTIVVFANGLKDLYPRSNIGVFRDILSHGGLFISEKLWNHKPRPFDFPSRNRIISGISEKTLIMSCSKKSGSYVTASTAINQGRDVYTYQSKNPLFIHSTPEGNKHLIADGCPSFSVLEDLFAIAQ